MTAADGRLPAYLLTGFLGSGKTTLLNALLGDPSFANTAVVVNEFGEIGLDHLLVERSNDNVVLLEAGCLCCTIADSLHETLADLHFRRRRGEIPAFARVIIETTGLADPAPILNTLLGNRLVTDQYRLDATIVTVDAQHALAELDAHREAAKQIAVADRLVVTKLDLAPLSEPLIARLRALNPAAEMIQSRAASAAHAAFAPLPPHTLRVTPGTGANRVRDPVHDDAHDHPHHDHATLDVNRHDDSIRAHCFVVEDPASWAGIAAWWRLVSERYGDRLLRCKGILRVQDTGEITFIQGVQRVFHRPERLPGWPDADHRSRLVCITRDVAQVELATTLDALKLPPGSDPNIPLSQLPFRRTLQ